MTSSPGKLLVALEGIAGVGKTTLIERLKKDNRFECIPQLLPNNDIEDSSLTIEKVFRSDELKTQAYLSSSREVVVMDRYYQSTFAYHWATDQIYKEHKLPLVREWYEGAYKRGTLLTPDLTIFIDIQPSTSFSRKGRKSDNDGKNPWLREDFLGLMRQYYTELMNSGKENMLCINGEAEYRKVEDDILKAVSSLSNS